MGLLPVAADAAPELAGPNGSLAGGWFMPDLDEEIDDSWVVVPRFGYMFGPRVGLESELGVHGGGVIPSLGIPYSAMTPRAGVFMDMAPHHWARPFAIGGVGVLWKKANPPPGTVLPESANTSRFVRTNPHYDFAAHFGGGLMLQIHGPWFFRSDARLILHWGEDPGGYPDGYSNVELTAGVAFRGGERNRDSDGDGLVDRLDPCMNEAEDFDRFQDDDGCPDPDNDKDGILDNVDRCDDEAEDFDDFEDRDGCPDPDNDRDGINDWADECPLHAEDNDGFDEGDGCPEGDNDGDGVPDDRDACPNEPEDRDGVNDEDGCPDSDNDQDGIPDAADDCPSQPETFNGYDDTDGCPDEEPPPPETYDGVIKGINFKSGKAEITVTSYTVLDEVVATLTKYTMIRIEVQGHTDSDGSSAANLDLSARRARAVVEYLINRGIDPSRLEYVGFGESKPLVPNTTREQKAVNRRVEFRRLDQ